MLVVHGPIGGGTHGAATCQLFSGKEFALNL